MRRFLLGTLVGLMAFALVVVPVSPVVAEQTEGEVSVTAEKSDVYVVYQEEFCEENEYATLDSTGLYKYDVVNNTAKITAYVGTENKVAIPETIDGYTVTAIKKSAFVRETAVSVTIPATITLIEEGAFYENDNLTDFVVATGNTAYKVVNGALLTADGKNFIAYPNGRTAESYVVPDGVECIGASAFRHDENLRNVTMPDSVKVINDYAFYVTNITDISFGNNLSTIGDSAFNQCCLQSVNIPDSVTTIGKWSFAHIDDMKSVTLGKNVRVIGESAFYCSDSITELHIPASVTFIGENAINLIDSLVKITVAEGNTSYKIVNEALLNMDETLLLAFPRNSQITEYVVPNTVKRIGKNGFGNASNLKQIVLHEGLEEIGESAFQVCRGLTELKLPTTVSKIESDAFGACSGLTEIVIPAKVRGIESTTFRDCTELKSVFVPSEVTNIDSWAFVDSLGIEKIYYVGNSEQWTKMEDVADIDELVNTEICFLGNLKDFVARMYSVALGRDYDAVGLNVWVLQLVKETHDGAGLAKEFVLGEEFALRNLSDQQYIDTLYTTFFNREADVSGKELWLATLSVGQSREYVLSQFVNSDEFTLLCLDYGINRGVMFTNGTVAAPGLPQFVIRLYGQVLGRAAEKDGLYNWSEALVTKTVTAEEAAVNFFMSQEYVLKNVDSTTFVTDCYSVFMDREADAAGLAFWVACLDEQGVSRQWVISEFAKSAEFKVIAAKYGL